LLKCLTHRRCEGVFKWFSTVHNFRVADLHITVGMKMDCNDFSTIEGGGCQIEMVKRII
jgi:hypothetical protein